MRRQGEKVLVRRFFEKKRKRIRRRVPSTNRKKKRRAAPRLKPVLLYFFQCDDRMNNSPGKARTKREVVNGSCWAWAVAAGDWSEGDVAAAVDIGETRGASDVLAP